MCCDPPVADRLPPPVAAMLAGYRALATERPADWGGESDGYDRAQPYARWLGNPLLAAVFSFQEVDWPATVRACLADPLPAGLVVARLEAGRVTLRAGAAPYVLEGGSAEVAVVLDSALPEATQVEVGGAPVPVEAGGVALAIRAVTGEGTLAVGEVAAPAGQRAGRARLAAVPPAQPLVGGGRPRRCLVPRRPAAQVGLPRSALLPRRTTSSLDVPGRPAHGRRGRGLEFGPPESTVDAGPAAPSRSSWTPERLYDPAADGWYGGDLHVHMNYSGDQVLHPDDAAAMQLGEGLHLMSLVAGNLGRTAGVRPGGVRGHRRAGPALVDPERWPASRVEYRNDLLGHVHALGLTGARRPATTPATTAPTSRGLAAERRRLRRSSGRSAATSATRIRSFSPLADGPPTSVRSPRSVEARELVADAALGLVDSVELVSCSTTGAPRCCTTACSAAGCGWPRPPAPTCSCPSRRGPLLLEPARVGAGLRRPAGGAAVRRRLRRGHARPAAPWRPTAPGSSWRSTGAARAAVSRPAAGGRLRVTVRCQGLGVERLELRRPRRRAGRRRPAGERPGDRHHGDRRRLGLAVRGARGPGHPSVPGPVVFAHTSPVWVEVGGRPVRRPASARWCWTGWTASRRCSASTAASPTPPSGPRSWPWSTRPAASTTSFC